MNEEEKITNQGFDTEFANAVDLIAQVRRGAVVKGTITSADDDYVYVDVHDKSEGRISRKEFDSDPDFDLEKAIADHTEVTVKVRSIKNSDQGKEIILSKNDVESEKGRAEIEEAFKNKTPIEVKITRTVKDGVIGSYKGVDIYIHRTQIKTGEVKDLESYVGQVLEILVTKFDTEKGRLRISGSHRIIASEERRKKTNYDLALDLNITPDAKINLPMDFQEVDVNVSATGAGNLHMNLSGTNTAQMIGNYEISSGTMKVGLLSVYEKKFTIENGSSMNFQGNVPDARFDMRAVYSQRVNMSTLTGSLSTVDNTQKYLQVENVIAIAGTLRDPKISFDIRLPNADQSVEYEVFAYIDRNSERDMMNQTISLLISGSFYNVNSNSQAGSNPLDIVTSFVGNSLTDMVQFVDVDIDFRSATELTNEQLDVNISKDWGRWYLESTLGYGGESRDLDASTVNGAIIDALIGYRLTPMFHLYAYNRTNTNDYTRIDMPYKQGAGLKVTKDFDSWGELFGIKKKSVKKKEKGEAKK